jgi:hypothetical protein
MPLQNRVTPTGEIVAADARGTLMGNRGCIHRPDRTLGVTRWRSKMWIACRLEWKGVRRNPMPPGRWTALFFLDEATALAAGHRPCAYCRRSDFNDFAETWRVAEGLADRPRAPEMDAVLHRQRVESRTRRQRTTRARLRDLPDGAMVRRDGIVGLWRGGVLLPWSFDGYGEPLGAASSTGVAEVLTPSATVAALAAGYRAAVHPTGAAHT